MFLQLGVDQRWDRLVRRRPVAIPATENAVLDARKRIRWQRGLLQPLAELGSVVGGLAVIGCSDDDEAPLLRQRTDVIIERPYRGQEAAVGRILSYGVSQVLGCAEVGAIQDQQRHLVRFCGG